MLERWYKKGLVVGILVLFVCMSVIPSSGITNGISESLEIIKENVLLENHPPYEPSNPYPNGNDISICPPNLSWTGGDPDGDNVTYDVYFGDYEYMEQVAYNLSETWFQLPDILDFVKKYYWCVVARDEYGAYTTGPIWSFITEENLPPNPAENRWPFNGDEGVPCEGVVLKWKGSDPNECDILRFDVYFDDVNPPVTKRASQISNDYWEVPFTLSKYTTYYWRIDTWDKSSAFTPGNVWYFSTDYFPPSNPIIDGPYHGVKNQEYEFTFVSVNPENDYIQYQVKWDDGTENLTELYPSGEVVTLSHSWSYNGEKVIQARAIDEHGVMSGWSTWAIVISRNKPLNFNINPSNQQKSENKEKLDSPVIIVHVTELYGTPGNPQYRPLANVTVKIRDHILWWNLVWSGKTNENGRTEDVEIMLGVLYRVIVSKDGYIPYKDDGWTVVGTYEIQECHVYFTMVKDDSPFIQQSNSQSSQQSTAGSSSQIVMSTIIPSAEKTEVPTSGPLVNDGSLSGYVNDTSGNPIEGALVRVYFHETYEEDYSDSTGYYYVINIPICYCMKNVTCSKEGYKTEWVLLGIVENTTHDFILTSYNLPPFKPTITGPAEGKPGQTLTYVFNAVDPDGDDVRFLIDWGDSTSDTTTFVPSGYDKSASHMWDDWDTFPIVVRAEDTFGNIGPEATRQIPIQRNKATGNVLFLRFLEQFPLLREVLLRLIPR